MKRINFQTKALLCAALLSLSSVGAAFSQTIHLNKLFPEIGGSTLQGNNEIRFVCPDSNRIYVLGQGLENDSLPYIFTAAVDYSGNVIWKKKLSIDPALQPSLKEGYHNLIKLPNGNLVAAGNLYNYPLAGNRTGAQPFLYFFNSQGDSIRFEVLADSTSNRWLNSLNQGKNGGFIAAGLDSSLDYYNSQLNSLDDSFENYWFARVTMNGNLQHLNKISVVQVTYPYPTQYGDSVLPRDVVKSVYSVPGDSVKYLINVQWFGIYEGSALNIETDSNFKWLWRYWIGIGSGPEKSVYYNPSNRLLDMMDIPGNRRVYPFNFLNNIHNNKFEFYYSTPGWVAYSPNSDINYMGAIIARVDTLPLDIPIGVGGVGIGTSPPNMLLQYSTWDELLGHRDIVDSIEPLPHVAFFLQSTSDESPHWSHLKKAINGNLWFCRVAYLPIDSFSSTPDYPQGFFTPFIVRIDENDGHVIWGGKIQYAPTKNDSSVTQHILDMSVAPSGCLVMGGYVNVNQTIPGYDSLGKNSWLVVLCDSVHDHNPTAGIQIPEAGDKAEILVYPNPTTENAFVVLKHFQGNLQNVGIQVCNINGRVLQHQKCHSEKVLIRLNGYASGIYLIKVLYKGKPCGTVKLVKD